MNGKCELSDIRIFHWKSFAFVLYASSWSHPQSYHEERRDAFCILSGKISKKAGASDALWTHIHTIHTLHTPAKPLKCRFWWKCALKSHPQLTAKWSRDIDKEFFSQRTWKFYSADIRIIIKKIFKAIFP